MGWAVGPADVVAQLASAKQTTDQCSGGLGQRVVEEYGRAGHFERQIPASQALYASHWRAVEQALRRAHAAAVHVERARRAASSAGSRCRRTSIPTAMRAAAIDAGVTYVPGRPFYAGEGRSDELRVSFSHLGEADLHVAVERLAGVIAAQVA